MSKSPDQLPGAVPTTPTPAPEPSPGATPEPVSPPPPPGAVAEPESPDDEDEASDLAPDALRSELDRARRSAARYRTERNTLREQIAALQSQIAQASAPPADAAERRAAAAERRALIAEEAAAQGIALEAIRAFRRLDAADSPDAITQALTDLRTHLAGQPSGVPRPPSTPTQPASLDDQIRAAEGTKNIAESLRLKAAKLAQTPPPR